MQHACQCPCGTNQFSALGEPIVRFFCHCTICGEIEAPFADVTLFKHPPSRYRSRQRPMANTSVAAIDRIFRRLPQTGDGQNGTGEKGYAFISTQNFVNPEAIASAPRVLWHANR